MNQDLIDYNLIGKAQTFYKALGYQNVDTPWLVSPEAIKATLPSNAQIIRTTFGCLVGSGEQGFIQLMLESKLRPGKYQTSTPCFRDEKEYNDFTRLSFFKTELIWYMPTVELNVAYNEVLNNALSCMFEISNAEALDVIQTPDGFDICCNNIELGSYGVRQMGPHTWVYGTGLAEPRFSLVVQRRQTPESLAKQKIEQEIAEHEEAHRLGAIHSHDGGVINHTHEEATPIEETSSAAAPES